jgi:hypothetical protein
VRSLAITTSGPILDKENYVVASLNLDGAIHPARMRGRGNYTWTLPKKPYKVKLDKSTAIVAGTAKSKDWALLANLLDESNMRTAIVFEIARSLHVDRTAPTRWAPRSDFCEVTLNGTLQGLYQLIESVDVQAGRVDIREMSADDTLGAALTGPYLLEQDTYFTDPGWITPLGGHITYDVPDVVGVPSQEAYIQNWINSFERLLITGDVAWLQYADLTSWADWYLIQELTKNYDSQWRHSCKFYKDQGHPGKVVLWPPWDFDLSLGAYMGTPIGPTDWLTRDVHVESLNSWIHFATLSPVFMGIVRSRWNEQFLPVLSRINSFISALSADISAARERDRAVWFTQPRPDHHKTDYIISWLGQRRAWLSARL